MNNLILVRHGQSIWNKERRFTGFVDVELTEEGKSEAERAGHLINELNIEVITNYSKIICVNGSKTIKTKPDQNISIIASEVVDNIKIVGLKYSLINKKLYPSSIAISNKAISSQFDIESTGKVFVFLNHIEIE